MTIGILLHPYGEKKPSGLGRYILELSRALIESDSENNYLIFVKEKPKEQPDFSGNNWRLKVLGFGRFWRELGLFFAPAADVYLFNTPILPFFFRPKKSIVIALDFAYKYFKPTNWRESLNNWLIFILNRLALRRADLIVAISEATKNDLIKFFKISAEKIRVIYPGFKDICALPPQPLLAVAKPFFLFVGAIKERKNVFNLVAGSAIFKKKYHWPHKLVIAGKKSGPYGQKIADLIKKENLTEEVIFLDFISDEHLSYLYRQAEALIFPSIVEGFGFPILEAMACGLPVITSNISSLKEVAGGAACLVDPLSPEKISEAMRRIVSDENFRQDLITKGSVRVRNFSWQKSAAELLKIFNHYEDIIN